jgi:hypothetical protein
MLAALLSRFGSREAVVATAAQAALTWASNHLAATAARLAQEVEELTADLDRTTSERDEALHVMHEFEDRAAELLAAFAYLELDADEVLSNAREDAKAKHPAGKAADYPAAEDVAPLDTLSPAV